MTIIIVIYMFFQNQPLKRSTSKGPAAIDYLCCWSKPASFSQVRLQTQPKPKPGETLLYRGTFDCFKKTLAKEVRAHAVVIAGIINGMKVSLALAYVSPSCL